MSKLTPNEKDANVSIKDDMVSTLPPEICIGISAFNKPIPDEVNKYLNDELSKKDAKCSACGVSIDKETGYQLSSKTGFHNTCGMCYFTCNLDEIPHYEKGKIIYFPVLSQVRLNAMLRALWAVDYLSKFDYDNLELSDMSRSLSVITSNLNAISIESERIMGDSNPDIYASMLNLLPEHEYEQRYKLLKNCRWLPTVRIFEDEAPYWAQKDYNGLHPEKITGNITKFMAEYLPSFKMSL